MTLSEPVDIDIRNSCILIVDDDVRNLRVLQILLDNEGYHCQTAASGDDALSQAASATPDLVILDIMMPGMDGYEVATILKSNPATSAIPIIMATALEGRESILRALSAGAEEYLTKPIDSVELKIRVRNLLRLKKMRDLIEGQKTLLEALVRQRTRQLERSYLATIEGLGKAADYRDDETGAHVRRIGHYSRTLAQQAGKEPSFCELIYYASPLHDVGKIGTPDSVLLKPGLLNDKEWEVMKRHTLVGESILSGVQSPYAEMGKDIAVAHHERWDGSGYPYGIAGEAIPLPARIMSICDVYDALRSMRPYKKPIDHEETVRIILNGDGRTEPHHFDPEVRDAFAKCADKFEQIYAETPEVHTDEHSGNQTALP